MNLNLYISIYLVVFAEIFALSILLTLFRRKKFIIIMAASFLFSVLSGIILTLQRPENLHYTVILANSMIYLNLAALYGSVATFLNKNFQSRKLIFFVAAGILFSIFFSTFNNNIHIRSILNLIMVLLIFTDLYLYLKPYVPKLTPVLQGALRISILLTMLTYIIRVILVFLMIGSADPLISNTFLNAYVFISYSLTNILWFGILIFMDSSSLLEEVQASEEKYRLIAQNTAETIWVFNIPQRRFTFVSPRIRDFLGYEPEEALKLTMADIVLPEYLETLNKALPEVVREFTENPAKPLYKVRELQQIRNDGSLVWAEMSTTYRFNDQGEIEMIGVSRNIDERKKNEEAVCYMSIHDSLTGLLNRQALLEQIEREGSESLSALFLDLDNFRLVNESLGHEGGDKLLSELGSVIEETVGNKGAVYRYGGDEFVILASSSEAEELNRLAADLLESISRQLKIHDRIILLSASIGICPGGESLEKTIKHADMALYVSKKKKNSIRMYDPSMEKIRTREAVLEEDLQDALKKGQFTLHYQPILDLNKGTVTQVEALLRWNHPELGLIPPHEFIPIAEKTRLIIPITDWVIQEACRKVAECERGGRKGMVVNINISIVCCENRGRDLAEIVGRSIREAGISPNSLELEITETSLMQNPREMIEILHQFREAGIKLALDDFGTGYSSFAYLKELPIDVVKIAGSLIGALETDEKEQKIIQAMIAIAQGLGLKVVAEGVETARQYELLRAYGCDYIQGFFIGRGLPQDELKVFLDTLKVPGF